jgi:hypothetical protein
MSKFVLILVAAVFLVACGEKPQALGANKQDAAPHSGTGKPYAEGGWKAGDRTSWESQLKARAHYGQNDFSRMQ